MRRRRAAYALAAALAATGAAGEPFDLFRQPDVAERMARLYNERDAGALHAMLAPDLRALYPPERLSRILGLCRALTHDILRLSPPTFPSMNARNVAFFSASAETGLFELVVEIDPDSRILRLLLSDRLDAPEQPCLIGRTPPGSGRP